MSNDGRPPPPNPSNKDTPPPRRGHRDFLRMAVTQRELVRNMLPPPREMAHDTATAFVAAAVVSSLNQSWGIH